MTGILSRYELEYLNGKLELNGKRAANARFRINRKLKDFFYLELPLLENSGYLDSSRRKSTSLAEFLHSLKGFRFMRVFSP